MTSLLFAAVSNTLPDSTFGDSLPLIAGLIVVLAIVGVIAAIPRGSQSLRERHTHHAKEFFGTAPPPAPETGEEAEASAAAHVSPPWGNLDLGIYDEAGD